MRRARLGGGGLSIGTAILALVMVGITASAATLATTWSPTPDSLAEPHGSAGSIALEPQAFFDPQQVELAAEFSTPTKVLSTGSGIVTAYHCRPGETMEAGRVLARVGQTPVVALASRVPLWRTISATSQGPDVDAVRKELNRLRLIGPTPPSGSPAGSETIAALADLAELPTTTGQIPATTFAWIPRPRVKVAACPSAVGGQVSVGSPLIELAAELTQVSVKTWPGDVVPGPRVLTVDGVRVSVGKAGAAITPQGTRKLRRTALFRAFVSSDGEVPLQGTLSLKRGLDVVAVPAGSVIVTSGSSCVSQSGIAVPVQIVTSELGKTLLTIDPSISSIDATPPAELTCT